MRKGRQRYETNLHPNSNKHKGKLLIINQNLIEQKCPCLCSLVVNESVLTKYWHFQQDARDREEAEEEEARRQEEEARNQEEEARRQAEEEARRREEAEQQEEYEEAEPEPEAVYEEAGEPTMQESEPTDLYEEVTQPQETTQEEVHLDTTVHVFHWMLFLYFEYSGL